MWRKTIHTVLGGLIVACGTIAPPGVGWCQDRDPVSDYASTREQIARSVRAARQVWGSEKRMMGMVSGLAYTEADAEKDGVSLERGAERGRGVGTAAMAAVPAQRQVYVAMAEADPGERVGSGRTRGERQGVETGIGRQSGAAEEDVVERTGKVSGRSGVSGRTRRGQLLDQGKRNAARGRAARRNRASGPGAYRFAAEVITIGGRREEKGQRRPRRRRWIALGDGNGGGRGYGPVSRGTGQEENLRELDRQQAALAQEMERSVGGVSRETGPSSECWGADCRRWSGPAEEILDGRGK